MHPDAKLRYAQQKQSAKQRGIEFDFTFGEWWAIWAPHFDKRGRASDQLQMCRDRDEGAYRPGNVRIDSVASNLTEQKTTLLRRQLMREGLSDKTIRETTKWVQRDNAGAWGGDYFRKLEYAQENPTEFDDDESS